MSQIARNSAMALIIASVAATASIGAFTSHAKSQPAGLNGPAGQGPKLPQNMSGDISLGRDVFRFETFGNEGFWTDAVRLPAGVMAAKVTPMQALELGLQVDADAINDTTKAKLAQELRADPSGRTSSVLNDAKLTPILIKANAVIGMSAKGDKVGTSCALCHTMTDASVFKSPHGGSIGKRIDGLANHDINLGKIFATAANTRALYPVAQLQLAQQGQDPGPRAHGADRHIKRGGL
jgi:hypothetical protein